MEGNEKPPDPGGGEDSVTEMDVDSADSRKRLAAARNQAPKKRVQYPENESASISNTYVHPSMENPTRFYGKEDGGPYVVHVSRTEEIPNSGVSLKPIKIGLLFVQNKVTNIVKDGIRSVGRNRVSVEFKTALDANNFISSQSQMLARHKLTVTVPSYNISRMGLVRGVPVEWSMQEFVEATDLVEGPGRILKARRLHRKVFNDGSPTWVPTQTVVLTFEGQLLPEKIYAFFTSLAVEVYQLPTIQCRKCLRFGHIMAKCRSDARCFRCTKKHLGDECNIVPEQATCLFCSGRHFATDRCCPEFSRQRTIKLVMSENSISYAEASARFPPVRRSYSDVTKSLFSPVSVSRQTPLSPHPSAQLPSTPKSTSYRRAVTRSPKPFSPRSEGFDRQALQNIVGVPSSQLSNGCALTVPSQKAFLSTPDDNFLELLFKMLTNIISKWSDVLPNDVAPTMIKLAEQIASLNGFPSPSSPTNSNIAME